MLRMLLLSNQGRMIASCTCCVYVCTLKRNERNVDANDDAVANHEGWYQIGTLVKTDRVLVI